MMKKAIVKHLPTYILIRDTLKKKDSGIFKKFSFLSANLKNQNDNHFFPKHFAISQTTNPPLLSLSFCTSKCKNTLFIRNFTFPQNISSSSSASPFSFISSTIPVIACGDNNSREGCLTKVCIPKS